MFHIAGGILLAYLGWLAIQWVVGFVVAYELVKPIAWVIGLLGIAAMCFFIRVVS